MPRRFNVLARDNYYHVFNRSIHKIPIFTSKKDCIRVINSMRYYRFENPPMRFSYFIAYGEDKQKEMMSILEKSNVLVEFNSFCLMPNHFHFLLRQKAENGISIFMSRFQNSFTRFRNTKYDSDGTSFKGQFKAVLMEDDEQLLHVHRYIHLNPYTSYVVKTLQDLEKYPYSSLPEYIKTKEGFCVKDIILSRFSSIEKYKRFIFDQADYQRKLDKIKHLIFE